MGADMKRDLLEILNIIFLTAVAIAFIAVSANGQTPDDVLAAQAKADAYMQTLLAEAAQPGPPSRGTLTAAAPASGDYYERLTERVQALEAKVTMLAARLPAQKTTETLTPAQEKRLDAVAAQVAEMKKTLADYLGQRQPTLAATQAKDHVCDCGPNCRCVGQCNCRWAGECLGVPDSRVQRSVVTQPATTVRVLRTYSESPYRSNGSVGGSGGYSSGYYPSYSSGYSSSSYGSPVYCVDAYGNPVPCN
jgi:hypothetical protein